MKLTNRHLHDKINTTKSNDWSNTALMFNDASSNIY